jgi:hypothetical protein
MVQTIAIPIEFKQVLGISASWQENFLPLQRTKIVMCWQGNLYLLLEFLEPIINPIMGMPRLPRTKGTATANFELIEVHRK